MWKIRTRGFALQEILIMAAMNVAPAMIAADKVRANDLALPRAPKFTSFRSLSWQK
jgi:hypothetical protein